MTTAVDARWMVGQFRGMGRYAHALLEPVAGKVRALVPSGFPETPYATVHSGRGFFPYWEQVEVPRLCAEQQVTQLLCPYNTAPMNLPASTRLMLVVHDLIYLEPWTRLPPSVSAYQTLGRIYRRTIVPRVVRHAARLLTSSEYTRDQLVERFSIPADHIRVIPCSLDDDWFVHAPVPAAQRQPYILTVAGEAPSKNLAALIRAFAQFRRAGGPAADEARLRIVGIKPPHQAHFRALAAKAGVAESVDFESFVDTASLRNLYREARLFVMASLYEGFGIPVLEAMASGTPAACSNTTSLPEVAGGTAWLFDPRSVDDMAAQLHAAWFDEKGRAERATRGLARAEIYRRSNVAASIAAFWREA